LSGEYAKRNIMSVLVTGAAGFIGFHTSMALLARGETVVGYDSITPYYDIRLKHARLALLRRHPGFSFVEADLADTAAVDRVFATYKPDRIVHLGAQAGVRYSIDNPRAYIDANIVGFLNILEACRAASIAHLVYASSSSVYGANSTVPFAVGQAVDHPVSLYAATKKSNELMAHTYAHLFRIPVTGLRFFTVYGPWGRPDMSYFKFTRAILAGEPIDVYNHGQHARDFTYIDDIVDGILRTLDRPATPDPGWSGAHPAAGTSSAPYRLYNIGNNDPAELLDMIAILERALGVKAKLNMLPMQPGDVVRTYADIDQLTADTGFRPRTGLAEGLERFVAWYREYNREPNLRTPA
jgi:UDP-glucuronate 4-epimerase